MPKVPWGIGSDAVDDWDRKSQYTPYSGPIPPNGVYEWTIKVLKSAAGTKDKLPSLWVGLELEPRRAYKEEKYAGYFIMAFLPVADTTAFRYVPFLDAIGVRGREFTERTVTDTDGNITRIGSWRNSGKEMIAAELKDGKDQDNKSRKEVGWMGPLPEEDINDDDDDAEEYADDEYDEEIDVDDADDEEPF